MPRYSVVPESSTGAVRTAIGLTVEHPILVLLAIVAILPEFAFAGSGGGVLTYALWIGVGGLAAVYVEEHHWGQQPEFEPALEAVLNRALSLIGVWLVTAALTVVGLVLFVLPGLYVWLRLSLATPAVVVDGQSARDSLETSWELTDGIVFDLFEVAALLYGGALVLFLPVLVGLFALALIGVLSLDPAVAFALPDPIVPYVSVDFLSSLWFAGPGLLWRLAVASIFLERRSASPGEQSASDVIGESDSAARYR